MASQQDVDAITTAIGQVETDLKSSSAAIQTELDALATANPSVDLTGLRSAVSGLDPAVQAIGALKPLTPQPPAPGPGPTPGPPPPAA